MAKKFQPTHAEATAALAEHGTKVKAQRALKCSRRAFDKALASAPPEEANAAPEPEEANVPEAPEPCEEAPETAPPPEAPETAPPPEDEATAATQGDPEVPRVETEPKLDVLSVRTLREATKDVLGYAPKKRTLKGAHAEVVAHLEASGRDLAYTCLACDSIIDGEMPRCWACGLRFSDSTAEEQLDEVELKARADKLDVPVEGRTSEEIATDVEEAETKKREKRAKKKQTARNVDLLSMESKWLNEKLTEEMPDGWRKTVSKQYASYFNSGGKKRLAVFHRGLKVQFFVEDGYFDGFPDLEFYSKEERRRRHFGRVAYVYSGDTAKYVMDLARRIFEDDLKASAS